MLTDSFPQTNTTWEEQQKMDAVRKAYQHAVQIPMENVKRLWEEYQEFENGLNRITVSTRIQALCSPLTIGAR